ncbi:hypothetical protein Nepgr_004718 [Nepenthes gracilis]|uniref:RING-type domain-containing protein n=1 Tax=Nepenthes gracilis TaxID=150966 RepID=A0AAD3XFG8_NEPGR|nr:hypothetical protein Nepgr_004718 [Nepenthes gracilis]
MIFFVYQSNPCIATLIFYTCFYFPFRQAKQTLLSIINFLLCAYHHSPEPTTREYLEQISCPADVPTRRFGDLTRSGGDGRGECDELCSVCLVEFGSEDLVSRLSQCGHVFHAGCVERWLERDQFTCPLCRSVFPILVHGGCSIIMKLFYYD